MSLVTKYYEFQNEKGEICTYKCQCQSTDRVVAVIMPKIESERAFLGRYLTARGFSTVRAARIAIYHYLWNRFLKLKTRFDVGIGVYPLREYAEAKNYSLLFSQVPCCSDHFVPYDNLPYFEQELKEFHRSVEENKLNAPDKVYTTSEHYGKTPFLNFAN